MKMHTCGPIEAAERSRAAALRRQWFGSGNKVNLAVVPKPMQIAQQTKRPLPAWKTSAQYFDEHLIAYYVSRASSDIVAMMKMKSLVARIPMKEIMSPNRHADVVAVKNEIAYVLFSEFQMGYSQIGKMMGIDHTSALARVRNYCRTYGIPMAPKTRGEPQVSQDKIDLARTLFESGKTITYAARAIGHSETMLRQRAVEQGWYRSPEEIAISAAAEKVSPDLLSYWQGTGLRDRNIARRLGIGAMTLAKLRNFYRDKGLMK